MKNNFQKDFEKAIKKESRRLYGFIVTKISKNKKKYNRKKFKKIQYDVES